MAQLRGQTVVLIGGSAGIGLETARRARKEGAEVILTGRTPDRLERAASAGSAEHRGVRCNRYGRPAEFLRWSAGPDRPCDGHRGWAQLRPTARHDRSTGARCALELAPFRVNLIAAGFVDTPLSATLLGDRLEERREELRESLPIRRVVTAADVAALAVHLMANTALTGATYDVDGGQQFVP